ncbi:uncharacterized protein LOC116307937 [Actinia tenebrosa]|uniref:Uncharacterized protein LOC116307937 n=1 Tax=Actinia tenebrosa TaxID=6105 RepID=A0A6P8J2D3_ACTTE|nr:uncharacterized protein LOC116307937 [Actinia tenebrosa]
MEESFDEVLTPVLQNILMEIEKDPNLSKTEPHYQDCFFESITGNSETCLMKENHSLKSREHLNNRESQFQPAVGIYNSLHCDLKYSTTAMSGVHVEFLNLREVYEKAQTRINRKSRQRIIKGRVDMVVTFDAQIQDIAVMVERIPKARALAGDQCGQVSLEVSVEKLELNKQYFSVDLDSIYLAQDGRTPVYKLSTVDAERRNRFHLAIVVIFIDGTRSQTIFSRPFLLRSKKTLRCFRSI